MKKVSTCCLTINFLSDKKTKKGKKSERILPDEINIQPLPKPWTNPINFTSFVIVPKVSLEEIKRDFKRLIDQCCLDTQHDIE